MLVTGYPAEEAEISVLGGQVDVSMTVIGLGIINRGSIFAMSKSREEAGVSVPCRASDSVDAFLEGPSLGLNCGIHVNTIRLSVTPKLPEWRKQRGNAASMLSLE